MSRRLLSSDPYTGIDTFHEYDPQSDETRIIHIGDSEPYLEQNKREANDTDYTRQGIKNEWWKYASIPPAVQVKWLVEHGVDVYNPNHGKEILALVNHPDYKYLKTTAKYHR